MRKCIAFFLIFCLILGLFTACFLSPQQNPLDTFARQLSELSDYSFVAAGAVSFVQAPQDGIHMPLRYAMDGGWLGDFGQFFADLHYSDYAGRPLYEISLLYSGGDTYAGFVPLFQYIMDREYSPHRAAPVSQFFDGGSPALIHPTLNPSALLMDIPALIRGLSTQAVQENVTIAENGYFLELQGDQVSHDILRRIAQPFILYTELGALTRAEDVSGVDPVLYPLLSADAASLHLKFWFSHDPEANAFTIWTTLTAPGLMTITADVTYRAETRAARPLPYNILDMDEVRTAVTEYRAAQARAIFIYESGLDVIPDLPELHMVDHRLNDPSLLEPFEMQIGDEIHTVSVMVGANNTANETTVFSISPAMTILYTTLAAYSAAETMAPFVLQDLAVEDYYAENFQRTNLRTNAHDTAAVNALYFDDNLRGRTVHIYVLQTIGTADRSLFMGIIVMLDDLTNRERNVLQQLSRHIGIDFQEYLTMATQGS
ncbi:MAG: hypothetical protein FWC72_03740 [Oscillospiraceae bacterium]|nr:hypothetical protein [Oscillospiraceae bacterium]